MTKNIQIMGILNVTPDSFSDGGKFVTVEEAVKRFHEMVKEGADIVDIGGESTGPGSKDVSIEEEIARVIPVIKKIRETSNAYISVDTYKAEVAKQAIEAGANMVNDILALRGDPQMAKVIADTGVPVVLMYSKNKTGRTTADTKEYDDVIATIRAFFDERVEYAESKGIKRDQIVLDPGQGAFVSGDPKYSYEILERLSEFHSFGMPILVGSSMKSFIGGKIGDRLEGSLKCAKIAAESGADIIRVHHVKETRQALNLK